MLRDLCHFLQTGDWKSVLLIAGALFLIVVLGGGGGGGVQQGQKPDTAPPD